LELQSSSEEDISSSEDPKSDFETLEEFMGFKGKALKDLDAAKSELEKRAAQIQELATKTSEQFGGAIKINSDLKGKIIFLQDLISSLSRKNEELEQANKDLQKHKEENVKLTKDLRNNLEKVVLKEKELELQRDYLSRQVDEKSSELMKSEKLAIIGELASRMAHDLRNPLSTIKNTIELMESKPKLKIEEKLQYYGRLRRAMNRMSHQVDDVLDFVRTSELKLQPYSVLDIINIVKDSITIPNDVSVKIDQENVRINCDYRKIEAVFTNLLLNAIQAVETKGEVHIRIIDNVNDVLIAFEDSGKGIESQNLSKIFDPLFTTKQLGTGLGLSICKSIVEQHGGNITVKNNPTTFLVRLPKNL
jgi:signal transduction histidine kinase